MANASERTKDIAAKFALEMGKRPKYQAGGGVTDPVVTGPLLGVGGGRTDKNAISVPPGSFVVPADIVSGIPSAQGNSLAGHDALDKLFKSLPLLPDEAPYGAASFKLARGRSIPGLFNQRRLMDSELGKSKGGTVEDKGKPVPIMAADGEYIVRPEYVRRLGLGNMERGHRILDEFVDKVRKDNIRKLRHLPGTVKDGSK